MPCVLAERQRPILQMSLEYSRTEAKPEETMLHVELDCKDKVWGDVQQPGLLCLLPHLCVTSFRSEWSDWNPKRMAG